MILLIFDWDDGLGPENTSVTFGAIILNGLTVIAFTRQLSAADADWSEIHSSPATLRGGYNNYIPISEIVLPNFHS